MEKTNGPEYIKQTLGLKQKPRSSRFQEAKEDGRIFPNYFAPVIVNKNGQRVIKLMRYRVRPTESPEEIPSQYAVYNARLDSLEKRKTWEAIFLKNHGVIPFTNFYEWVEREGKKQLVTFKPKTRTFMHSPVIYDTWESKDKRIKFDSFAIITTDPNKEVEEQGHDRCPIFIRDKNIDHWLDPKNLSKNEAYKILSDQESEFYECFNAI